MNNHQGYQIRRSSRAKRLRIVVTADKVEAVAPLRMPERKIHQFMRIRAGWVEAAKNEVQQHVDSVTSLAPASYQQGALIPYQGAQYKLQIYMTREKQIKIAFEQCFTAYVPECISKDLNQRELSQQIQSALISWMGQEAAKQAAAYADKYAPMYKLTPRSISIKAQKSRWGSCGIHNDINLNWLLILAPAAVFEYVLIHELCHIEQRNHSAAFWALVARHCPDYQQQRGWLKRYGASLMLGL
ncbi:uncharacterized protein BJAS_P3165 [Bathymodiolus japonicus methanotrophic gill symbiont]|uniref:M48 family metallopeptidase n=1 Tax=Bathymodiolus japonicus methanotrophic gill symbiont TaxID=113269 RepID=UPI001B684C90|nr:SprT family zinc-dependent metalloprotease [Bathymodiolus japonicus methanotrophic gill symbiont]GFO72708.1 uncharacterized protein BJAS_P3165 [Bathymodiolus japonicus methanotrophic gill symbiont]